MTFRFKMRLLSAIVAHSYNCIRTFFSRLDETLAQCANDAEISFVCAHINISLVGRFSDCVVVKTLRPVENILKISPTNTCSPPRNCSHQALPFIEAAAKAQFTGSIETQPGVDLATLSAFRIVDVPIMAARNKDVRSEWVVLGFHCHELGLDITFRRSESFRCVLKARRTHAVQSNISAVERQAGERFESAARVRASQLQFFGNFVPSLP
jgi:hypothetical protein